MAHIDYYADVYDEPTVAQFAALRAVSRAAATDAELPVTELPLIPADATALNFPEF